MSVASEELYMTQARVIATVFLSNRDARDYDGPSIMALQSMIKILRELKHLHHLTCWFLDWGAFVTVFSLSFFLGRVRLNPIEVVLLAGMTIGLEWFHWFFLLFLCLRFLMFRMESLTNVVSECEREIQKWKDMCADLQVTPILIPRPATPKPPRRPS